jgi:hypothetical protein
VRRFIALVALAAGPLLVACGGDAATTSVEAVTSMPVSSSTDSSSADSSSTVSSPVPSVPAALLIDALPELTGPTVLWFWAPG